MLFFAAAGAEMLLKYMHFGKDGLRLDHVGSLVGGRSARLYLRSF
jgi:hypothetical protein